jgi:hypothetical protein
LFQGNQGSHIVFGNGKLKYRRVRASRKILCSFTIFLSLPVIARVLDAAIRGAKSHVAMALQMAPLDGAVRYSIGATAKRRPVWSA